MYSAYFSDFNECENSDANDLPKVSCGFGNCVNVIGTYRCHCDGDVDQNTGNCLDRPSTTTTEDSTSSPDRLLVVPVDTKGMENYTNGVE